jgi:hypothetical protein
LPPGLESSGLEPDDRASQRRDRKRKERKASQPDEPKVSRASGDGKPRKLRGRRDWKPLDEPDSGAGEGERQREPEKVAAATGAGGVADSESRAESRPDETEERASGERRDDSRNGDGPSDTDAMGQDKRRQVIGQRYGASRARQFLYYGIFVAFLVAIYIGGQAAVSHFDKAPKHDKAQAPWAKANAPGEPLGGFEPRNSGQKGPTRFP